MEINDEFEAVTEFDLIPDQGTLEVGRKNGDRVCLIRRGNEVTAVNATCTHQDFPMSFGDVLQDGTIQCAWHGAKFDCRTGEVKQIPATEPLPIFEVRIQDNTVFVGGAGKKDGAKYSPSIGLKIP